MSWTRCDDGHPHWGEWGAAGLLLVDRGEVVLARRSFAAQHGGTWSIPGGAEHRDEGAKAAALREAAEEIGLEVTSVRVEDYHRESCGGWPYVTVIATSRGGRPDVSALSETLEVAWVPIPEIAALELHPSFARSWPGLRRRLGEDA